MSFSIDAAHLRRQWEFSSKTFGSREENPGVSGVLDHISKELEEIEAAPEDITEWADLIILAFDGAQRAGHDGQDILDAVLTKQAINEGRRWPDWRTVERGKAVEHVRS